MENKCIKVGIVNYKNTLPLLYGLEQFANQGWITIHKDYPAKIAQALKEGLVDIGLIPVAAIPKINGAQIIGNYGIAANDQVASVCLFSHVPIKNITHVYLDYQSNTSVQLVKILFKEYWQQSVEYLSATDQFISKINGTIAGVIIGDRAFEQLDNFEYVYDLSACWKLLTGLPFVFAVWVANTPITEDFITQFDNYNSLGLQHIEDIVAQNHYTTYDLKKYFTVNIDYNIDMEKRKAIDLFLSKISTL
jgi:chorismate dehydratase